MPEMRMILWMAGTRLVLNESNHFQRATSLGRRTRILLFLHKSVVGDEVLKVILRIWVSRLPLCGVRGVSNALVRLEEHRNPGLIRIDLRAIDV